MARKRRLPTKKQADGVASGVAQRPVQFPGFRNTQDHIVSLPNINVLHLLDNTSLGGTQTMVSELVAALELYYGPTVKNHFGFTCRMPLDTSLARSYGVAPVSIPHNRLKKYAEANSISIVLHHRTSSSRSYREFLSENVAYIVVNHSVANPISLKRFVDCDFYISVCDFLDSFVTWPSGIHPSRKAVILNGVEDSYLTEIPSANLSGTFKSGRCHRLVPTKFKSDSLTWFQEKVASAIPGSVHYVIGNNQQLKQEFGDCYRVKLLGTIYDRFQKMSIIKSFDVYFYETFYVEGASIAILESLACGVPVLCKSLGGCPELIRDGVNGFIFKDRKDALKRLKDLARNRSKLRELVESTQTDFSDRLHIRHTACRYVQVFEAVLRNRGVSK